MKSLGLSRLSGLINYATCIILLPFTLMMYQYQRNIQYLSLWQVLFFSGIVACLFLISYFITKAILKTEFGAFSFNFIIFISFFMYRVLLSAIKPIDFSENRMTLLTSLSNLLMCVSISGVLSYQILKMLKQKFMSKAFPPETKSFGGISKSHLRAGQALALLTACVALTIISQKVYDRFILFLILKKQGQLFFSYAVIFAEIVAFICWKFKAKLKSKAIPTVIFVILSVVFVQNVISSVLFASKQQTNDIFYKEDFTITEPINGQPNIYWIHTDGMLGFDSMSRFFGEEQDDFTQELDDRGFWINREAAFDGNHSTQWALPSLMSPYYYDSVLSWVLDPEYAQSIPRNNELLVNPSLRLKANFTSNRIAREKNETIAAFNAAGYNTSTIDGIGMYFYPTVNQFYDNMQLLTTTRSFSDNMSFINDIADFQSLLDLLGKISLFPETDWGLMRTGMVKFIKSNFEIREVEKKVDLFDDLEVNDISWKRLARYDYDANSLYDTFGLSGPKFTVYSFGMAHGPFGFDESGSYVGEDASNPMRYPAHHKFSTFTLLRILDIILENDPDAVIVLQADHGLHHLPSRMGIEKVMDIFSCTREEASALWNSVMSAVRLPEGMITSEAEAVLSDPRNISRYLVNNFIGENYDYIPYQYKQTPVMNNND